MLIENFNSGIFGLNEPNHNLKESFLKGNLFPNIYESYKGMNYLSIVPKNDKERLLLELYIYDFAINDLCLYLDIYPHDKHHYEQFQDYCDIYKDLKKTYETKYGPLSVIDDDNETFTWYKNPWPWEGEGVKYV